MLNIVTVGVRLFLLLGLLQSTDGVCPIPDFFHGDFFALERGEDIHVIITGEKFESQIFTGECHNVEQIEGSGEGGEYHARIIYLMRNNDCYICHEMYHRTPNVLQVKKSSCISSSSSSGDFADVCSGILPQTEVMTMFRKIPELVNCNETFEGIYQFSYEIDLGGHGLCHNRDSIINSCQVPGSPYVDNQVFTMRFASCPNIPTSTDKNVRFQCLGTWKEGDKVFSAVMDLTDSIFRSRFRCLLTREVDSGTRTTHYTMSRFAQCLTLLDEYQGPIRLVLNTVYVPQDDGCGFHLEIEGATRKNENFTDVVSYTCEDGLYFDDNEMSQQTSCTCFGIEEVLSWGICHTPPPVTVKPEYAGPRIVLNPADIFYNSGEGVAPNFQCSASGYPQPTYKWFMYESAESTWVEVNPEKDASFEVNEGKLAIIDIVGESLEFFCHAENVYGAVRSDAASVVLAYIGDFPRAERDPHLVQQFRGAAIECNAPYYEGYTALHYGWYKDTIINILRPGEDSHMFISQSGKLYFSSVIPEDSGNYHCYVSGKGSDSAMFKSSMPIPLQVQVAAAVSMPPQIAADFPSIYPSGIQLLMNENVTLECFAYGTSLLDYTWEKEGDFLPTNIVFSDLNRVLTIVNIQMADAGTYNCTVTDGTDTVSRSLFVGISGSAPYFVKPLEDQFVVEGSDITLSGTAGGEPLVSYVWFFNGMEITDELTTGEPNTRYTITENVLIIKYSDVSSVIGMYQLRATNVHGTLYSTAQVWEIGPISGAPDFYVKSSAVGVIFILTSLCLLLLP